MTTRQPPTKPTPPTADPMDARYGAPTDESTAIVRYMHAIADAAALERLECDIERLLAKVPDDGTARRMLGHLRRLRSDARASVHRDVLASSQAFSDRLARAASEEPAP